MLERKPKARRTPAEAIELKVLRRNAAGSWTTIVSPSAPVYLRAAATSADGVTHVAGGRGVYLALTSSMTGSKE